MDHATTIRELGEGAVGAVCSCGWRSPVSGAGKATGTMDPLRSQVLTFPGAHSRAFTGDGANRLPRLEWSTPPAGTQELAIEMLDPNVPGGTFTHWLVYGLRPGLSSLTAVPADAARRRQRLRPARRRGPGPPRGAAHRYHFVVLALDTRLGLAAGATRSDLDSRTSGHVLGRGGLVATYRRA